MRSIRLAIGIGLLIVSALWPSALLAQTSSTGALTVNVVDTSGAVIPGATVTITNTATGVARSEITGEQGAFRFSLLPVGTYSVAISLSGFKSAQVGSVTINVTETRVLNQVLQLGAMSEEVTVNAEAEAVQTGTSALGTVVGGTTITSLPLVTRNYTQILGLSPGTISNVVNAGNIGHGSPETYVNGMLGNGNSYQMDGADINALSSGLTQDLNFGTIAIPNPDTLQEFKVQTSQYDAGFGRNAGGNVNVVTKSGTNNFHGALFEFFRNDALNANDFFRKRNGQPRPVMRQNQYGFTLGGPIVKGKLFFFGSYQKTAQKNGLDPTATSAVTLPARLTDDRSRAALGLAFCPQNNLPGASDTLTRFGGVQVACDGSNINPVALQLLNHKVSDGTYLIPSPQRIINPGTAAARGSSVFSVPATYDEDQVLANLDYVVNPRHTLAGRGFYAYSPQLVPFKCNPCVPGAGESSGIHVTGNNNALVRLTSVLRNNIVNEARVSSVYLRAYNYSLNPMRSPDFGITPAVPTFPLMPVITVQGMFGFGGAGNNGESQSSHTTQWSNQLSWATGRHSVRLGYQGERYYWDARVYALARGSMSFQTFPDFLLGMSAAQNGSAFSNVNNSSALVGTPSLNLKANSHVAFFQDDFQVTPKLTLNMGVRWEYMGLVYDSPKGNTHNADWNRFLAVPIPPAEGTYEGLTMGKNYPGDLPPGVYRRPGNTQLRNGNSPYDDFAPRIGIAWQPFDNDGRFVVRGGYGLFFTRVTFQMPQASACCGPPQTVQYNYTGADNVDATFQKPFPPTPPPDPTIPPAWTHNDSGGPAGFGPWRRYVDSRIVFNFGIDPDQTPPLVQTWNVNFQYGLRPSLALEAGYVNSRVTDLATLKLYNVPQLASPSNPINCGLPTGCITTNTAANAARRVPVIGLVPGGVRMQGNYSESQHHALQVELRQRMSHGLQFGTAYTLSKTMNDFGGIAQQARNWGGDINIDTISNDPRAEKDLRWGRADYDRRHRFVVNFVYRIPGLPGSQAVLDALLSGWELAGVGTIQSGTPLTITDPRGGAVYGFVGTTTGQLCAGATYDDVRTKGHVKSRVDGYLNSNAFCAIPIVGAIDGVGGATGRGNSGRAIVDGPGQANWDLAFSKSGRIGGPGDSARLEFRAEVFNALNTPQFNNPATALGTASFGVISSTSVAPRIIQFALKYVF